MLRKKLFGEKLFGKKLFGKKLFGECTFGVRMCEDKDVWRELKKCYRLWFVIKVSCNKVNNIKRIQKCQVILIQNHRIINVKSFSRYITSWTNVGVLRRTDVNSFSRYITSWTNVGVLRRTYVIAFQVHQLLDKCRGPEKDWCNSFSRYITSWTNVGVLRRTAVIAFQGTSTPGQMLGSWEGPM